MLRELTQPLLIFYGRLQNILHRTKKKSMWDKVSEWTGLTALDVDALLAKLFIWAILLGSLYGFIYITEFCKRPVYDLWKKLALEKKIENIRRRYIRLKANEAILCNVNFGADKKVPIGKFTSDTNVAELRKGIRMIERAIINEMAVNSELQKHIKPFLKEQARDCKISADMPLTDTLNMLQRFAKYVQEKEPVLGKMPQDDDILAPSRIKQQVAALKKLVPDVKDLLQRLDKISKERRTKIPKGRTAIKGITSTKVRRAPRGQRALSRRRMLRSVHTLPTIKEVSASKEMVAPDVKDLKMKKK